MLNSSVRQCGTLFGLKQVWVYLTFQLGKGKGGTFFFLTCFMFLLFCQLQLYLFFLCDVAELTYWELEFHDKCAEQRGEFSSV